MPSDQGGVLGDHHDDVYASFSFVDVVIEDGVAVATLNNPDKLNAADGVGHSEFSKSLRAFAGGRVKQSGCSPRREQRVRTRRSALVRRHNPDSWR